MLGFDHTQCKFTDVWTLSENLRSDVETTFFASKQVTDFRIRQRKHTKYVLDNEDSP